MEIISPDLQSEWDNNNDNEPDNFYESTEGQELETSIEAAFSTMLKRGIFWHSKHPSLHQARAAALIFFRQYFIRGAPLAMMLLGGQARFKICGIMLTRYLLIVV